MKGVKTPSERAIAAEERYCKIGKSVRGNSLLSVSRVDTMEKSSVATGPAPMAVSENGVDVRKSRNRVCRNGSGGSANDAESRTQCDSDRKSKKKLELEKDIAAPPKRRVGCRHFDPVEEVSAHSIGKDSIKERIVHIRCWLEKMKRYERESRDRTKDKSTRSRSERKRKDPTINFGPSTVTNAREMTLREPFRKLRKESLRRTSGSRTHSASDHPYETSGVIEGANDFSCPALQFLSFLDGTSFSTTDDLCEYNTAVAKTLSDSYLSVIRRTVFNYDEAYFAELLYGDLVAEELQELSNSSKRTPMSPQLLMEMKLAAGNRFNAKCVAAHTALLTFGGVVNDAIQVGGARVTASKATEVTLTK